jgi:hypothetical protein
MGIIDPTRKTCASVKNAKSGRERQNAGVKTQSGTTIRNVQRRLGGLESIGESGTGEFNRHGGRGGLRPSVDGRAKSRRHATTVGLGSSSRYGRASVRVSQVWQRLQGIEGVCPRGLMLVWWAAVGGSHSRCACVK